MEDKYLEMNIDDALIEKPYGFTIETEGHRERHFYLYPVSLGKLHLLKRHIENLEIDLNNLSIHPNLEALRVVKGKRAEVCRMLAYHTLKKKRDIFDNVLVEEITSFLDENASDEDLASLLVYVLGKDDLPLFKKHLGITAENDRLSRILEAKRKASKSTNDYSFGGKTIYGTLIDVACERYGWPYDYVLWGISFVNLQLMLADKVQSVYISEEEKKHIPPRILSTGEVINADDPSNKELILSMDWK